MPTKKNDKEEIQSLIKDIKRSSIVLSVLVGIIIIMFILIVVYSSIQSDATPQTFDELLDRTLDGYETETNFLYNGFVFALSQQENVWYTRIATISPRTGQYTEYDIPFYNNPRQTEDVLYVPGTKNAVFGKDRIYITFDPDMTANHAIAGAQVGRILGQHYDLFGFVVESTLTQNPPSGKPPITCNDVSNQIGVIYMRLGSPTAVFEDAGCIIIQGQTQQELIKAAETFTFVLLEIYEDRTQLPQPQSILVSTDYADIEVVGARYQNVITGRLQDMLFEDRPQGVFFIPTFTITNTGNETLRYNPIAFATHDGNQTNYLEFVQQRFLPQRLQFDNELMPGQTRTFQVAFDIEQPRQNVNTSIKFLGGQYDHIFINIPVAVN